MLPEQDGKIERWKKINTPSGNYRISTRGRVKSISRWLVDRNGKRRFWKKRILVATPGGGWKDRKYLCIVLDGKNYWVHKLVALAFIPPVSGKRFVNHKDGNKMNNDVTNLEWCTRSENMIHAFRNGLYRNGAGLKNCY